MIVVIALCKKGHRRTLEQKSDNNRNKALLDVEVLPFAVPRYLALATEEQHVRKKSFSQ